MDRVGPTNPYHISRAYGLNGAPRTNAADVASASAANPGPFSIVKNANAAAVARPSRTDSVDASATKAAAAKQRISTLVAAKVDPTPETSMRPTSATPATPSGATGGAFPMYRHPADKNAAATAVNAGKIIDLNA